MDIDLKTIGKRIRKIRESKNITINEIAKKTDFTPSFISQFERGLTKASVSSLQKITNALNINLTSLFDDDSTNSNKSDSPVLIRKVNRKKFIYPNTKSIDYLLTDTGGHFEAFFCIVSPNEEKNELYTHGNAEEAIIVLNGMVKVTLDHEEYVLEEGDTITFNSNIPHLLNNIGSEDAKLIWIVSPPTY